MWEVTISVDGILQKTQISANDSVGVYNAITNMYGSGKVQIINMRRI